MKDNNTTTAALVDELGTIRAQIAALQSDEKQMKARLVDLGEKHIDGDLFKATVVESNRNTVDWKAVAEKLNPSHQLIAAHTRKSVVTSVRTAAKPQVAA